MQKECKGQWSFREEMTKYCRADVELLSKAVLAFRKMFTQRLDVDPWRYTTLASLCMAIYRGKFIQDKTIVSNDQNKKVSQVSKEWLLYLGDKNLCQEIPIKLEKTLLTITPESRHRNKLDEDDTVYYRKDQHAFTVDAADKKSKRVKEFFGCYFHGCPKCHPDCRTKYNKAM
eukprot:4256721-Heterocapsa_arctica.AAC.2